MTSEATAAKDAAAATTTFSLKPQHADGPAVMLVFRWVPEDGASRGCSLMASGVALYLMPPLPEHGLLCGCACLLPPAPG